MKPPILGIVIPCYNEEEVLVSTHVKVANFLSKLIEKQVVLNNSFLCYVNDGSRDKTWDIIDKLVKENKNVKGVRLSRNFGHQSALLAGISESKDICDCCVSIDADLQDDITVIEEMIQEFNQGVEIVFGVRRERKKDGFIKKITALGFYRTMNLLGVDVIYNSADFRLTSARVNHELDSYSEVNLFLRGIFPSMGFKQAKVYYDRKKRLAGETKYPFNKMISFAFEGITSFSIRPLRLITVSGLLIFLSCFILSGYVVFSYLQGNTERGWSSTVLPSYLLGGLQIFFIGIVGEYLGKIYKEVKRRPRYLIDKSI